jgi:hypothetical protein
MRNPGTCDIENTVIALEQAIKNRKEQMHNAQAQGGPSPVASHLFSEILNRAGSPFGQISLALEHGGASAQDIIKKVQRNVEEKPWDALRKIAVYSFGIGLFLSRRHRRSSAGDKE